MNCQEARELFSAKADDRLTPAERLALDRHLQECSDCPDEWGRFRQTVGLLHSLEEVRAPAGFAGRVLEAAHREQEPWPRRLWRGLFVPLHVKLPLEAAALLLVSTLVVLLFRQVPELQRAEVVQRPTVVTPAPTPASKPAEPKQPEAPAPAPSREVGSPRSAPLATPSESGAVARPEPSLGDRPEKKEEAERTTRELSKGRGDAFRQGLKVAPAPPLESRARGPFHVVGALRPKDPSAFESQLTDLVKRVGGVLVSAPETVLVGAGNIVEILVSRDDYPRLEAGLRQIGDVTVETRAPSFPEQLHIAIRIAN